MSIKHSSKIKHAMALASTQGLQLSLLLADSFNARLLGLHAFGGVLPLNTGLWIRPCRAIHTLGLPQPIDVVFLDAAHRPISCRHLLRPWRVAICTRARSLVELPGGFLRSHPHSLRLVKQSLQVLSVQP